MASSVLTHAQNADKKAQETLEIYKSRLGPLNLPYARGILNEIFSFEEPIPSNLKVEITMKDEEQRYEIKVEGYEKNIADASWINCFVGPRRNHECSRITSSYTQLNDKNVPIKVLLVESVIVGKTKASAAQMAPITITINPVVQERMRKRRQEAAAAAKQAISTHYNIPSEDKANIQGILEEAYFIQDPVQELRRELIKTDHDIYELTLEGYEKMIEDKVWSATFLAGTRREACQGILATHTQMTGPTIIKKIFISSHSNGAGTVPSKKRAHTNK